LETLDELLLKYKIENGRQYIEKRKDVQFFQIVGHEPLIKMIEDNGAPYCGGYIKEYLSKEDAGFLFKNLAENPDLLPKVIGVLPYACIYYGAYVATWMASKETQQKNYTEVMNTIKKLVTEKILMSAMSMQLIKSREDVVSIMKNLSVSSDSLQLIDQMQFDKNLMYHLEPFLYGGSTPLCETIKYATNIFYEPKYDKDFKFLLIISDGEVNYDPVSLTKQLNEKNVTILSCLLTPQDVPNARQLYDTSDEQKWDKNVNRMFQMSSFVSNTHPALSILSKQGWIFPQSGKSRLFVQTNCADVVYEFCSIVRYSTQPQQ